VSQVDSGRVASLTVYRLAHCDVSVTPALTVTLFADGRVCEADHEPQPGQHQQAKEMGFPSALEMNRTHDLTHNLLAHVLGLGSSPTLYHVSRGQVFEHWRAEEAAVLAFQAYAQVLGINLQDVAARWSKR
jgi:hypothetical protein